MDEMMFSCEKYGVSLQKKPAEKRLTIAQQRELLQKILPQISQEPLQEHLPYNTKELVKRYPDVEELAYIDLVGEITEERLDKIISKETRLSDEENYPRVKDLILNYF